MKFRSYEIRQIMLLPESLEDLVPENHLVRAIDMVVEQINLNQLYNSYGEEGQPAYHPKMLIKILFYVCNKHKKFKKTCRKIRE